jgi:pyruvate dehydrogenase E1 component alpha subunit
MRGSSHAAIGQEAVAVGACAALAATDLVTSTHRGHGHTIAKGGDPNKMMAEIFGRQDGYCHGKGGSMHIADFDIGMIGANGIVGAGIGIATGAALSAQLLDRDQVVLCFFGDGALNQGIFLEAGNMAAIWNLPVVYICENNHFAMSATPESSLAVSSPVERAKGIGLPAAKVDGMDALAVHSAVREAADLARSGEGPRFLEAECYRFAGHFSGDTLAYRNEAEVAEWQKKDPIANLERRLVEWNVATEADFQSIQVEVVESIESAIAYADASPWPTEEQRLEDLYA